MDVLKQIAKKLPKNTPLAFSVDGKRNYLFADGKCRLQSGDKSYPAGSKADKPKAWYQQDVERGVITRLEQWAAQYDAEIGNAEKEETEDRPTSVGLRPD